MENETLALLIRWFLNPNLWIVLGIALFIGDITIGLDEFAIMFAAPSVILGILIALAPEAWVRWESVLSTLIVLYIVAFLVYIKFESSAQKFDINDD